MKQYHDASKILLLLNSFIFIILSNYRIIIVIHDYIIIETIQNELLSSTTECQRLQTNSPPTNSYFMRQFPNSP